MLLKKFNPSEINPSEWYSINRFTLELESQNSPCVSVYYPHDKNLETLHLLRETKRDENTEKIESAIEKRIIKLSNGKNHKKRFTNTYCIFLAGYPMEKLHSKILQYQKNFPMSIW